MPVPKRRGISINCLLFWLHSPEWAVPFWTPHIVNKRGVCAFMGLGIGRALWWFSMHNLSYSRVRVRWFCMCVFVHSPQTGFLWVFCGWPVQINIVNRLCVCVCVSVFEMQIAELCIKAETDQMEELKRRDTKCQNIVCVMTGRGGGIIKKRTGSVSVWY